MTVTLTDAERRLGDLLRALPPGETLVVEVEGQPYAQVTRLPSARRPRKAGSAKDTIHWMADDFDAPLDEFREYLE